jgi:hypothetical protein
MEMLITMMSSPNREKELLRDTSPMFSHTVYLRRQRTPSTLKPAIIHFNCQQQPATHHIERGDPSFSKHAECCSVTKKLECRK